MALILYLSDPLCIYGPLCIYLCKPLFFERTMHLPLLSCILCTHYASFFLLMYSSNPLCIYPSKSLFFEPTMHLSV